MSEPAKAKRLTAEELSPQIAIESFEFQSTDELAPLDQIVAQPRVLRALDLALGVRHASYHVYAAGASGTGSMELLRSAVSARIGDGPIPPDWMYLHNFAEPDRPIAISLVAGQGNQFKAAVAEFINGLADALPKAFRQEDFSREKERIRKQYQDRGREVFEQLEHKGREKEIGVQQLPDGQLLFIPLKDGRPLTPEEVQALTPDRMRELDKNQEELLEVAGSVLERQQELTRQLADEVRNVVHAFARRLIKPRLAELSSKFVSPQLQPWFEAFEDHLVAHLDRFRDRDQPAEGMTRRAGTFRDRFLEYQVNLVIDNSRLQSRPVVVEDAPNYRNLFGTIERVVDRFGRVITNFSRIKAGSLLEANGGVLILDLMDALLEPFVWKELKRTLKSGSVQIEIYDPFAMFAVTALKPESIPLNLRLIVLGDPLLYHLLCLYDADFREIFRVKADFDDEMPRDAEAVTLYARLIRKQTASEGSLPFDMSGVAELTRAGARIVDDQSKLSTVFTRIGDVIREADYWARQDNATIVSARHVELAIREQLYRSDLIAEKIRKLFSDGTLIVDLRGSAVGQVNGLAVANLGDIAFGRPSRLTASVGVGAAGIVNIERESRLSGRTYDKAVLILEGYLRNKYAHSQALTLSASIAMEQSYGSIDGDSASVGELLCLLSALAGVPLRQDIAVTGSVNQWGQIQAIGGVNEKIEGFFDVCRESKLTGTQGVCIPKSNLQNLVLRNDVIAAVRSNQFHVWTVETVDDAIELLSGLAPGDVCNPESEMTFHARVGRRLKQMSEALRHQAQPAILQSMRIPTDGEKQPSDPRPPLPGRNELRD